MSNGYPRAAVPVRECRVCLGHVYYKWARMCELCQKISALIHHETMNAIGRARIVGALRPVEGPCVDCGQPAKHREHRDYFRPLDVDMVCVRCNHRRGPAIQFQPGAIEHIELPG